MSHARKSAFALEQKIRDDNQVGKKPIRSLSMEACTLWPMAGKPVNCWCECRLVWVKLEWNFTLQGINISHLGKRKIIVKMPFLGDMLVPWRVGFLSSQIANCETAWSFDTADVLFCFFRRNSSCPHEVGRLQDAQPQVFFSGVNKSCCIFFWKVWSSHHFFPTPPIRWVIFKTCQFSHEFLFEKPIGMTNLLDGNSWSIFSGIPWARAMKNITQNHQRNTSEFWDSV